MAQIREAELPADLDAVQRLWLAYLTWGNDGLEDSPDFMTAAHSLYRASGFKDIGPYPESEIPDEYKPHWIFMERNLV